MPTKFIISSFLVAIIFVMVAVGFNAALAEPATFVGEVTGFSVSICGFEVEVTLEDGNVWSYFDSNSIVIGERISITIDENEVVDVVYLNRLTLQETEWRVDL